MGANFSKSAVLFNPNGFKNLDVATWSSLFLDAAFQQNINKRSGTAIHDGHFATFHFDGDIVNAKSANSGDQMFNCRGNRAKFIPNDCAQSHILHDVTCCLQFGNGRPVFGDDELDPAIGVRW